MFEAVELGRSTTKEDFKSQEPVFRVGLLTVQYELRDADFPVIILLAGNDGLGCTELSNVLSEWMDPRYIETHVFDSASEEEKERPRFWRYWRALPRRGTIGLYLREWTARAVVDRALGKTDDVALDKRLRHIESFERELTDDGALLLKFWLHMPKKALNRRVRRAEKSPGRAWRVSRVDREVCKHYEAISSVAASVIRRTETGVAPWNIIESTDSRYRDQTAAQVIIQTLTKRLAEPPLAAPKKGKHDVSSSPITVLDQVDLSRTLSKASYEKKLGRQWRRLAKLSEKAHRKGVSLVIAFEGWDAAGKGGAIRRLTRSMDAAHVRVIPIAAPTEEERGHHYLWRFWRHLPRAGHAAIFDRTWYGRVLVERVEGFAREREWKRAYAEINDFEEQLADHGVVVLKFWLHLSQEEQLRRFKEREKVAFKKYKITADDYRNRERWNEYELAADEMVQRTSTEYAPWHLIAGNDKRSARVEVLEIVRARLERAL